MPIAPGSFGSGFGTRDANWITRHMPRDGAATLREVTSAWGVINLCGPRARDVLQMVSEDDVSNEALPFGSLRIAWTGSFSCPHSVDWNSAARPKLWMAAGKS